MNIIRKIGWFLKLEKKRYIVGILALSLVSVFNLIPPRVIGNIVDKILEDYCVLVYFNILQTCLHRFIKNIVQVI